MTSVLSGVRRILQALLLLAAFAVPLSRVVPSADAGIVPHSDLYLHRMNGAMADPVNVIFKGGNAATAAAAVQRVLRWKPASGSELQFWQQGQPAQTSTQLALDLGHGNRFHIRIEDAYTPNAAGEVLAGVHMDIRRTCGHIGGSFDDARDLVAHGFSSAGYPVTMISLGNTLPGRQCNGDMTGGDGWAAVIDLSGAPAAP